MNWRRIRRLLILMTFFFFFSSTVHAQNTNVSATITDSGGQAWVNGTYTFNFINAPRFNGIYRLSGSLYTPVPISGSLDGTGTFTSVSVPDNNLITPLGSQWTLTVCAQTRFICYTSNSITITGASQNITSSVIPPAILVSCGPGAVAYTDSEVGCSVGGQYYNLTTQINRQCQTVTGNSCTTWANSGGNTDDGASAATTGSVKTATNGVGGSYLVPGLNPSPDVSSTPYTIRCDTSGGGATTLDRAQTVRFVSGASVATFPDIGTSGCTAGYVTSLIAGVTITVNRTTSSTFDIYNGTNPPLTGQTTFSLPAGQHCTISPSASGTSWIVRFASAVTGASVTSTTPVTVTNPTINTDTTMIELALPAGFLNKAGMGYTIRAGGLYSNTAATSPALTFNAKLCTVSGCGSGTVVGLAQIVSGATSATATTNDTWTYSLFAVNNATGATGNLLVKGDPGLTIDLSNVGAAADTIYADVNTAVSGNIDLTAALFLDFTVAQSVAGASNSYKQLTAMIAPHASPAGAAGGGNVGAITAAGTTWVGYTIFAPSVTANISAQVVLTNNQPVVFLFNIPISVKATNATIRVASGIAASTGDVGIYNSSGTLVAHTGSFATATSSTAVTTAISGGAVTLNPGQYYLAACDSDTGVTFADVLGNGTHVNALMGSAGVPAHTWGTDATDTCTAGVLPASITTTNITNSISSSLAVPLILFSN